MNLEDINKYTKIKDLSEEYPWLISEVKKLSSRAASIPSGLLKMILAKATMGDIAEKIGIDPDELIGMLKTLIVEHEEKVR